MKTPGKPTFCEYVITTISGVLCVAIFIYIAVYCKTNEEQDVQNMHNQTPVLSTQSHTNAAHPVVSDTSGKITVADDPLCDKNGGGNPAFEHAIHDARDFEESIKTKNTLPKRVWHRLTHREEASRAAIILTALAILLFVAILLTKMWKEKDHYPLTMKQVVSYPQNDRKSEMLVTDMLKYRARSLVSFSNFIYHKKYHVSTPETTNNQGVDQTDKVVKKKSRRHGLDMEKFLTGGDEVFHTSKYRKILCTSSDEDSEDNLYTFKASSDKQKLKIIDKGSRDDITYIDSDDSGEDQVYAIDALTGEWRGYRRQPNIPSENIIDISSRKSDNSSLLKAVGRKALKTSVSISKKIKGKRTRTPKKNLSEIEEGSTVKLLNDYDTDDSEDEENLSLRLVDSSTDTSTNIAQ